MTFHHCRFYYRFAVPLVLPLVAGCAADGTTEVVHTRTVYVQPGPAVNVTVKDPQARDAALRAKRRADAEARNAQASARAAADAQAQASAAAEQARVANEAARIATERANQAGARADSESALRQAAEREALEALDQLEPTQSLVIEGHTDSSGSSTYNRDLSRRRASAVRAYLVEQGVGAERIVAIGRGEDAPVASNGDPEGRANNRRVEIVVSPATVSRR